MTRTTAAVSPLAEVPFRWLLAGRAVDQVGNAIQPIALGFAMLAVFGNATALGVVVGANSLGQVLLLLVGGVVADRLPRSVVLVWSNAVAAVAQAGIVALILTDVAVLPAFAGLAFVTGAAAAFDGPATVALIPEIVPSGALSRANGQMVVARRVANVGGAPLAGLLVVTLGSGLALAVDAVSFLVAAMCFSRVAGDAPHRSSMTSPLQDLVEGWQAFVARTWVWVIVAVFFVINAAITGGFFVVGLAIAERTIGAAGWGLVIGAFGAGSVVSAVVVGHITIARPLMVGMLSTMVASAPIFALASGRGLSWLVPAAFVAGAGIAQFGIAWETALQQHIPRDRLARVSSIDHLGSFAAIPIGAFVAGPLADAVGEVEVVAGAGVLVVLGSLTALLSREVRDLRATTVQDSTPPSGV